MGRKRSTGAQAPKKQSRPRSGQKATQIMREVARRDGAKLKGDGATTRQGSFQVVTASSDPVEESEGRGTRPVPEAEVIAIPMISSTFVDEEGDDDNFDSVQDYADILNEGIRIARLNPLEKKALCEDMAGAIICMIEALNSRGADGRKLVEAAVWLKMHEADW